MKNKRYEDITWEIINLEAEPIMQERIMEILLRRYKQYIIEQDDIYRYKGEDN